MLSWVTVDLAVTELNARRTPLATRSSSVSKGPRESQATGSSSVATHSLTAQVLP